jgi:hypothetical protein
MRDIEIIEAFATGMQQAGVRGDWMFAVDSTDGETFAVISAECDGLTVRRLHVLPRTPEDERGALSLVAMLADAGVAFARQATHA